MGGARRRDGAGPRARADGGSSASSTSTTPATRWTSSRSRSRAATSSCAAARSTSRTTGTGAPTSSRSPARSSMPKAQVWADAEPEDREAHFKERAYVQVLAHLKHVLSDFGVDFDVWFSERTLHETGPDGADRDRARHRRPARARLHLRARGRDLVPLDRVRRRQGPRAQEVRRQLHLLRRRHRVPQEQVRPRVRPRHQHLGRRPPRLRAENEGRCRRARPRRPARRRDRPAGEPLPGRRGGADEQAHRRDGDLRGAGRARSDRTRRATSSCSARATRPSTSTSSSPAARATTTPSTTCSTLMPDLLDPAQGRGSRHRRRGRQHRVAVCRDRPARRRPVDAHRRRRARPHAQARRVLRRSSRWRRATSRRTG